MKEVLMIKCECKDCDVEFEKSGKKRFCSTRCKNKSLREKIAGDRISYILPTDKRASEEAFDTALRCAEIYYTLKTQAEKIGFIEDCIQAVIVGGNVRMQRALTAPDLIKPNWKIDDHLFHRRNGSEYLTMAEICSRYIEMIYGRGVTLKKLEKSGLFQRNGNSDFFDRRFPHTPSLDSKPEIEPAPKYEMSEWLSEYHKAIVNSRNDVFPEHDPEAIFPASTAHVSPSEHSTPDTPTNATVAPAIAPAAIAEPETITPTTKKEIIMKDDFIRQFEAVFGTDEEIEKKDMPAKSKTQIVYNVEEPEEEGFDYFAAMRNNKSYWEKSK